MIRDITIGQYYPADSILHRLDPRVKLIGTLLFIVSLFLFESFYGYIIVATFLLSVIKLSKVPFPYIVKGMKAIVVLMLFTAFFNLFFVQGNTVWQWGVIKITDKGIHTAIYMAIRLTLLILGSSLMTFTI